ncbi:glycosyl hydrolase family 32 [Clostridium chromiireducens]|uniref:Glycosyl hydrolase family 32 n=1 Tax=Clostridium chromiireducens TaxID=225345 RepID=A0A399IR88_9CLOT|nr:GH32 C-terminal domain-containing protein [Clostridium chromiireducens]RII35500.1 glycosyl hydrolase family 32 [Clostridium chromiireducens]
MKKLKLKLLAITVATTTIATLPSLRVSAAWQESGRNWYYIGDLGERKTGWINDNGTWYYMQQSGEMKTGWVNDSGIWYYMQQSGAMKTGWVNDNGTWYYMQPSGAMKTGWINDNGTWYFAEASGAMQTGVVKVDGKIYYLDIATGAMQVGNTTINGKTYVFAQTGEVVGTELLPTKIFDSNGNEVSGNSTNNNPPVANEQNNLNSNSNGSSSGHNHNSDSGKVNKVSLINAITASKLKYEAAVEGTEVGQYKVGSKSTFKIAIDAAQAVLDNTGSTQKDIDSAVTALAAAMTIFDNGINKDVDPSTSTNYLEDYREQYHYSPAKAWANDPNGMVYFNGEYHLFYQYYPEKNEWGPMHWGHAVSTDLIHWKELGIAIAPDGDLPETGELKDVDRYEKAWDNYGKNWIYSGSAVIDKDNTSGFFDGIEGGGLVAVYTQHSENPFTEQQAIAYSKDNGRTWIKPEISNGNNLIISKDNDPLNHKDFRDPKIVYLEDSKEWLMAVAGGPLRFFSSKDLKTWKPEAMQSGINTECPDIYKLEIGNTGTYKWVLSEGGRYYRVGDLKKVEDKWTFVPDEEYKDKHQPMNFVKDSYAAQTYYGTGENGTPDGRRIMINWMNNWDYCVGIAPITKKFNGQFTLQNELKLVETNDGIRMVQQPIEEYKELRKSPITFENVTISPDQPNIMSNLSGSKYEIVAEFEPDENTKEFGFKLRVGKDADQETIVKYNTETGEVIFDRSKSGKAPSNSSAFLESYKSKINKTSDGKIQLNIFVDESSVEVYGNNGEVVGSGQIFPNRSSRGIEVLSNGGNTKATINYYPISSIWNNESDSKDSVLVSLSEGDLGKTIGNDFTIYTSTVPETADQGVTWEYDSNILEIVSQDDTKTTFKTKAAGSTKLTAISKDKKSSKTINVDVYASDPTGVISDLTNFKTIGDWYVKDNKYTGNSSGDGFAVAEQTNEAKKVSSLEATADLSNGNTAGLVLLAQDDDPKKGSIIANIDKNGNYRVFAFNKDGKVVGYNGDGNLVEGEDITSGVVVKTDDNKYKLRAEISDGHIKYFINDEIVCDTKQEFFEQGRFGFNVYGGEVNFDNVKRSNDEPSNITSIEGSGLTFDQNPVDLHVSGDSYVVDKGRQDNGFAFSDQDIDTDKNTYEFEVDAKILGDWHAYRPGNGDVAGIVLFSQGPDFWGDGGIVANVGKWGHCRIFARVKEDGVMVEKDIFNEDAVPEPKFNRFNMKIKLEGNKITFIVNGKEVYSGEQDYYTTGKFGFNVWNGPSEFRNITLTSDAVTGINTNQTTGAAVSVAAIAGVTAPVAGATPVSTITDTTEYTANIAWSGTPVTFAASTPYTATITITPKEGYTLIGVPKDFFTVEGATATNDADSGVITAIFPETN